MLREVRKANGAHLARGHRLLHGLPGLGVRAVGLVEQQQVEVVHVQAAQRGVDVLFALLVGVALGKQLGGDEELLARDAAAVDHAAHGLLVEVGVGGVHMAVADLYGLGQVLLDLGRRHEKDAVAYLGNLVAVVHGELDHGETPFSWRHATFRGMHSCKRARLLRTSPGRRTPFFPARDKMYNALYNASYARR